VRSARSRIIPRPPTGTSPPLGPTHAENPHEPRPRASALTRCALLLATLCAGLATAASGGAALRFGAAEDAAKYVWDGGRWLDLQMRALGMTENRVTVTWDPAQPAVIEERQYLDRMMPVSAAAGISVVLAVYPAGAWALADDPDLRIGQFAAFLQQLARTYPQVTTFVVGNEPNQPRFLQPQFGSDGSVASAAVFERLLAASYDALKAVNPGIAVVAAGPSGSGNDETSSDPVRFVQALGAAYRGSGRTAPIMDRLGFHVYPLTNTDPPARSYAWPHVGASDLDRLKQAVWDAFAGTGQPVFGEGASAGAPGTLSLDVDEFGWQVAEDPTLAGRYTGAENVPTIDEDTQARYYGDLVGIFSCDPTVSDALLFHLADERELERFQSGVLRADWSERPSFDALRNAIAGAGSCPLPDLWTHAAGVVGARATFDLRTSSPRRTLYGLSVTASEPADGRAGIFHVPGPAARLSSDAIGRSLAGLSTSRPVLSAAKLVRAGYTPRFEFRGRLRPGYYVYAVRLAAQMNPARTQTIVSAAFRVLGPATRARG